MAKTQKTDTSGRNNEFVPGSNISPTLPNSSAHMQEVTENVLSGDESIDYEELLDSLEEIYDLDGLSDYENPEEVRISYHISGSGTHWDEVIQIDIDNKSTNLDWIPDYLSSFKELIELSVEKWGGEEYIRTEETHTHSYHDKDLSRYEMENLVDNFQE